MLLRSVLALALLCAAATIGYVGSLDASGRTALGVGTKNLDVALSWVSGKIYDLRSSLDVGGVGPAVTGPGLEDVVVQELAKPAPEATVASLATPDGCASPDRLAPGAILVGDRIALRFFEHESILGNGVAGTQPVFFERLDLSGTYEVDARGELSIPLIGRIQADGVSLACVEALVSDGYLETFFAEPTVSAAFDARLPVIVTGDVRAPGTYAVGAGLSLRHVLALAGAKSAQGSAYASAALAPLLGREQELKRIELSMRLKMRALEAAQSLEMDLRLTAGERRAFKAELGPQRLEIEEAAVRRRIEGVRRDMQIETETAEAARASIALAENERLRLARQIEDKRALLLDLRELADKGLAPLNRLTADEAALVSLERAAFAVEQDLLTERARLAVAERAAAAVEGRFRDELAGALRDLAEELDGIEAQLASIEFQIAATLGEDGSQSGGVAEQYTIIRTSQSGQERLRGELSSTVLPGDLVEVTIADSSLFSRVR